MYPITWKITKIRKTVSTINGSSIRHFTSVDKNKKLLDQAANALNIKQMSDWYKYSVKVNDFKSR